MPITITLSNELLRHISGFISGPSFTVKLLISLPLFIRHIGETRKREKIYLKTLKRLWMKHFLLDQKKQTEVLMMAKHIGTIQMYDQNLIVSLIETIKGLPGIVLPALFFVFLGCFFSSEMYAETIISFLRPSRIVDRVYSFLRVMYMHPPESSKCLISIKN